MRSALTLLFMFLLIGCNLNDEDDIDCALFDPATPQLLVKFVDGNGNNLIENGSISSEDIQVSGDFTDANGRVIQEAGSEFPSNNTLHLNIPFQSSFEYTITVGENQLPAIAFTAERQNIACNISFFLPEGAISDNTELILDEVSVLQYILTIEIN